MEGFSLPSLLVNSDVHRNTWDWPNVQCDLWYDTRNEIYTCPPVHVTFHLVLCAMFMNNSFLWYLKLPSNHPYIIIYFTAALNKLKFLQQSGLSFWFPASLSCTLISLTSSIFGHRTPLLFLWFILYSNTCCLLNIYCRPGAFSIESPVLAVVICSLFYGWGRLRLQNKLFCWRLSRW